jgi:hypothetical protein
MSVHFKGVCYKTNNVICNVDSETKWNKKQPNLVIQGWAESVNINDNKITIE